MNIYLASSRKNEVAACQLGMILRNIGHNVYVFCDEDEPANKLGNTIKQSSIQKKWTQKDAMKNHAVQDIYRYDMSALVQANCVVMLLPCGRSAHLEAGYLAGKKATVQNPEDFIIMAYGPMVEGEWDAMYFMFDKVYGLEDTSEMVEFFREIKRKEVINASVVSEEQSTETKE